MTDEQIIKALECCNFDSTSDCEHCPLDSVVGSCIFLLLKEALDYINRLKVENERLKEKCDAVQTDNINLTGNIAELEKENADLYGFKRQLEDELIERGWAEYANGNFRVLSDEERDKVRKETAKEILLDLKKDISQCYGEYALSIVDEYIEKYGVEAKE